LKTLKPIHLLLIGSSLVSALILVVLFIADILRGELTLGIVILVWLCSFVFSFGIFYFLIKRFISDRLKILYRILRKGKFSDKEKTRFSLNNDVIADSEKSVNVWTEERLTEISKLKDQEEFRREFLGNLAHELKTPIFSIQGYILTLLDGGLEDENVNRKFLESASKATERMVGIIEDLDQITKLEVDKLKLEITTFEILELVQDVFDTLELNAQEKNISFKIAKSYEPTLVKGDRGKIGQVLTNLINNSISYGRQDGNITIRLYTLDDVVTIEVSDDGIGIDQSEFPRLFERFYRVEKSRNRHDGGSGLGLAIVKHIIESHGQSINVRSTLDVGSTFAFTLAKG
jgi:two-component system phosphate regulon sensor histidine kinase PhoR|tara:strand:- start:772 stop:1809 length:1038 start_codon:yes stop_codon:yes gene_type:complete